MVVLMEAIIMLLLEISFKATGTNTQWIFEYARSFDPFDPTNWTGTMPTVGTWSATPNLSSTARLFEVYPFYVR